MENMSLDDFYYEMYSDDAENLGPNFYFMMQIFNVLYLSITFILGIIGNGLVIWIAGFKMKKTVSILWFLNLAIADFVFVMVIPFQITERFTDGYYPFGQIMCKIIHTVFFLNMSVSASFLMIISVDRCTSVLCPVWSKNHKSPRMAIIISAITWMICFLLCSPYLAFFDILYYSENGTYCVPLYADDDDTDQMRYQTMIIVQFISMFLIPFLIIITCYSLILFRLKRSRSLSRSNKPLKVIITVVLCFFCFWFPFHTWPLLELLHVKMDATVDAIISSLFYSIGYFNSCVNPIVYVFVGRDFKKKFFKSIPFLLENTLMEKDESETEL